MSELANKVLAQARSWIGCRESNGSHKTIIDVYNGHKPLARGYAVKYTDAWCATFVSAVAIKAGCTDIIPAECGCGEMLELFKKLGRWMEKDDYAPKPGDIIFYDWQDTGKGDNKGWPDHVGIVESVSGRTITVIEGNYSNSVKRRYIDFDGKLIRGYGVPKYDKEPEKAKTEEKVEVKLPLLSRGSNGSSVKSLQILLIGLGYSCGGYGADGVFGSATEKALNEFKKDRNLPADGIVNADTWEELLGVIT
jgi:hypothetical protein